MMRFDHAQHLYDRYMKSREELRERAKLYPDLYRDRVKRSGFGSAQETLQKRIARVIVYRRARQFVEAGRCDNLSVLALSGLHPQHEASVARRVFGKDALFIDTDPRAIKKARDLGLKAFEFDLGDLRLQGQHENWPLPGSPGWFGFVNMDLCGLVSSYNVGEAFERATKIGCVVATWFSYGHDNINKINREADRQMDYMSDGALEALSLIPPKIKARLLYVWSRALISSPAGPYRSASNVSQAGLLHVFSYKGKSMPMMVALWSTTWPLIPKVVPYDKIDGKDYRDVVLTEAQATSSREAAELYGCTAAQIAAWKAVRTREAR